MVKAPSNEPPDTRLSIAAAYMLGIGFLVFVVGAICLVVGIGLTAGAPEACAGQALSEATGPCRLPVLWLRVGAVGATAGASSAVIALLYFGVRKLARRFGGRE